MRGLAQIQTGLLKTAAGLVRPNGKICYSTCSIQKAENTELVREFLKENPNFELEFEELTLPSAESLDHDGGYTAILVKCKAES
jgi:16S rRNA (cytosine967-C5)-methyltransferase